MIDKKRTRMAFCVFFFSALIITGLAMLYRDAKGASMNTRSRESLAMDTIMRISIHSAKAPEELDMILDGAFGIIADLDGHLSMHMPSSDISLVNVNAGQSPVPVSQETASAVWASLAIAQRTGGAFDPTIGPVSDIWKTRSVENPRGEVPDDAEIREALSLVGASMAHVSADNRIYLEKQGMKLDLGGIAKGYASGAVRDFLISAGVESALIDLGGNVFVIGTAPGRAKGDPWRIGIQHPYRPRGEIICSIAANGTSVITAGVYERYVEIGGKKYTHIFDPRTGHPVDGDLLSVTIVAEDPAAGDALSTAFMAIGVEKSKKLLESFPGVEAIFITKGQGAEPDVTATEGIKGLIKNEAKG